MLRILDHIPSRLLEIEATRLHEVLAGPTLIHLPGRRPEPLFVSILLHGNETTGLLAVQSLLRKHSGPELPRALSILIGNVEAAREGRRRLPGQSDYNRIWRDDNAPESPMAQQVMAEMRARGAFASIDIHNNTGLNPHYAIVNRLDHRFFHLATLFNRTVVYSIRPDTTITHAFSELCPAVALECGLPGRDRGTEHALEYLEGCLHLARIPDVPVRSRDMDLFHTVAIVKVPPGYSFGFGSNNTDIQFMAEMDRLNFQEIDAGTIFARIDPGSKAYLEAWDEDGVDARDKYFSIKDNEIRTLHPITPSMLTLEKDIIRMDCLCYLMRRIDWQRQVAGNTERQSYLCGPS